MLQITCRSFSQGLIIILCFGIISSYIEKDSLDYIPAFSESVENIFINFQGNGKIILKQSQQIDQIFQAEIETFHIQSNSKSVLVKSNWKKVSKTDLVLNLSQTITSSNFTQFLPEICIGVLFLIIAGVILIRVVIHFYKRKYKQHKNKKDKYCFKKMKLFNRKLNNQKNSIEVADQLTSDREDDCPSSSKSSSKNTMIYLPPTPEKDEIKRSTEKVIEYILNHFPSSNRKIKKLSGFEIFSICLTSIILLFVITVFTDMSVFTVKDVSAPEDDFSFIVLTLFIPQENYLEKIRIFAQQKYTISSYINNSAKAFQSKIDNYVKCHVINEIKIHKFILQIFDIPIVENNDDFLPCDEKHKCLIAWQQGRYGCNPNTKKCICQRGFRLLKGLCLDENECQIPLVSSFCESHSKCFNTAGTHICSCSRFSGTQNKHCSICQKCAVGSYDSNQCILPAETNCIDATQPVKKVSKRIDNIKDIITIKPAENVFGKNILDTLKLKSNLQFQEFNGRSSETILGASGLIINITLLNVNLPPIFEDMKHKSDNEFILNSTQGSNLYHLKTPLLQIMKNYCSCQNLSKLDGMDKQFDGHPLPDSYFITMTTYTDRHTKAQRYNCNQMEHPFNNHCHQDSTEYNSFYTRSINDQCSVNKAMFLSEELHSFYCVENNKLVNDIFKHNLKESVSYHPDPGCDYARRKCNTCKKKMCSKAGKSKSKKTIDENCCLTKCLNDKNCQIQYSSECHYTDRLKKGLDQVICMQGDTAKFTLNPQFDFKNNKFKCHIRKQIPNSLMRAMIQFSIPGKGWSSSVIVEDVPYSDPGNYNIGNITFYWSSKLNSHSQMILHGYQNPNHGQQFFSLSKINKNPSTILPKLQKHGDKSYIEVEFENIFEYSTSNWNSLSCKVNVSKIRPINRTIDYTLQNVMPVSIVHSDRKPFTYILKSAIEDPEIEIEVKENTSLIKSLLCEGNQFHRGRIVKDIQNDSFTAQLSLQKWPYQWNLLVEGFVSNDATFVNIQITDIATESLLADYEQIVFNPVKSLSNSFRFDSRKRNTSKVPIEFSTYFHIDLHRLILSSKANIQIALLILVQDCFSTYRKQIYLHPRSPTQRSSINRQTSSKLLLPFERQIEIRSNQIAFQKEMYHYLLQYLAIITFAFSIIYFFIISALIIIRLCSKTDQKSLMQKIHSTYRKSLNQECSQHVQTISTKRRMVLFLFVAFKVFYNFVFTLSVGLSLVLSLESNLTPFEITPSRFLFSVEQEVRKLDNYGSDEFRRQNEFVNTMNKACQEKRKNCEISLKNHIKSKYDTFIDPWTVSNKKPIYKSIGKIFNTHLQKEFEAFYNYSRQLIHRQINNRIDRYQSYINQFTNSVYIKTAIQFGRNATQKSNHSLKYYSILGSEIKSYNLQSIPDLYEPRAIFSLYVSFSNEYFKLHNITKTPDSIFKPSQVDFKETIQSKTKRYFQSTLKFSSNKKQMKFSPLDSEINKYYKTRMKIISKNNRFQLKISLWQMRLIIVFIDIIIITYRFYHTLTTIKIIWFGSHIYLSVNNCGKPSNREKLENDATFQAFRFVKFKHYIRNNPTIEIAEFGLSINKLFPCFDCCKRLYYVCIIISFTILIGVASIFVLSFYCMGRSQTNLPSSVADMTLQYMNYRINWLTSRHAARINTEKLNVSIFSDKNNRKRLTRLQRFFQHEETQIQKNLQYHVCEFLPANHFFRSLKTYCNNNYVNTVDCSQQSCYFINIKSLNYTENQFLKEMYSVGPLTTSLILIPLLRFIAVAMLVVSAILIMLGIIYHSSKLLARIFLKFSQPINATILNRNFPLLSKSIMKQHFSHSTLRSMSERTNTTFNTPNRSLQTNPIFLKDISNNYSSPVITRSTNSNNHSESRV